MVDLIKVCMNSLYAQSISKNIDEENIKRSGKWLGKITMKEFWIMNPYQMVSMLLKYNQTTEGMKKKQVQKVGHLLKIFPFYHIVIELSISFLVK